VIKSKELEKEIQCGFCKDKGNWKNVIRNMDFEKKNGTDIIVCNTCLNLYDNQRFEELKRRFKGLKP
jgi:hypothetical protein